MGRDDARGFVFELKCSHVGSGKANGQILSLSSLLGVTEHVLREIEAHKLIATLGKFRSNDTGAAGKVDNLCAGWKAIFL